MEAQRLSYKNSVISWYRFGQGSLPVICFHGYGEDATSFEFLGHHAGEQFSFYAIDLPFHGLTVWNDRHPFSPEDLLQIIEKIFVQGNHKPETINQKLLLLGYSLGGRVALSFCQAVPGEVSKMVLVAPDGLKVNFWYWLATQTWLGNKFFAFTMKHPGWFFGFLRIMNKLGLVNASIFKFVNYYIGDAGVRSDLYKRWTVLSKLRPRRSKIKNVIPAHRITVRLIYGKHDRIILSSVGEKFRKGLEEHVTIKVIPSGHQVLHEKHISDLLFALRH